VLVVESNAYEPKLYEQNDAVQLGGGKQVVLQALAVQDFKRKIISYSLEIEPYVAK
jgi:hypothetical protein